VDDSSIINIDMTTTTVAVAFDDVAAAENVSSVLLRAVYL